MTTQTQDDAIFTQTAAQFSPKLLRSDSAGLLNKTKDMLKDKPNQYS